MRNTVLPSTQVMHVCKAPLDRVDADMTTRRLDVAADVAISEVEWLIRMLATALFLLVPEIRMMVDNHMFVFSNRHSPGIFST